MKETLYTSNPDELIKLRVSEYTGDKSIVTEEKVQLAINIIYESKKSSATMLQRVMNLGWMSASYIINIIEEIGFIGPQDGAKARDIFFDEIALYNSSK